MKLLLPSVARARRAFAVAALCGIAALGVAPSDAYAQTGTLHVQFARLDDAASTYTLGIRYTTPLGDAGGSVLPQPGQVVERAGRRWLFTAMAGGGLSRSRGANPENSFTAVAEAGVLYRFEGKVESVGMAAYANLQPRFIGPAVTVRALSILEVVGGVGKLKDRSGVSWFAGAAISVDLLGDLGR